MKPLSWKIPKSSTAFISIRETVFRTSASASSQTDQSETGRESLSAAPAGYLAKSMNVP